MHPYVDVARLHELIRLLERVNVNRPGLKSEMAPGTELDDEVALRAYLWTASICHATKGALSGRFSGKHYKGWDYLLRAFVFAGSADRQLVDPASVAAFTPDDLRLLLERAATESVVRFEDLPRRAAILRATASEIGRDYAGSVAALLNASGHRVTVAYGRLARLDAFTDATRKKSTAFLVTVAYSGRYQFVDLDEIAPMVDYHRIRLFLRTGVLRVDEPVRSQLAAKVPVDLALADELRLAAFEATQLAFRITRWSAADLDVVLWAHARSCCRNAPMCASCRSENQSFSLLTRGAPPDRCVFQEGCAGANQPSIRMMWEPIASTENY